MVYISNREESDSHGYLWRLNFRFPFKYSTGLGENLAPTVVAICKKDWSGSPTAKAKVQSFEFHRRFMERQAIGDVNLKFAWFGTSRAGVERIMSHGFGLCEVNQNNGVYGRGVYLSPDDSTLESVQSTDVDDHGLRHVVLCRVLLGRIEVVHPCSDQTHPSSEDFHSGVDSLESPKKYIVWSTNMNTHILPEYGSLLPASVISIYCAYALVSSWKKGDTMPFIYDTAWDLIKLADYLIQREENDSKRIGIIGESLGGMHAWFAAAVDTRYAVVVPVIGIQGFRWAIENDKWQARVDSIKPVFDARENQ